MKTTFINAPKSKAERRQVRQWAMEALTVRQTDFKKESLPENYGSVGNFVCTDDHGQYYLYEIHSFNGVQSECLKFYFNDDGDVVIKYMFMYKYTGCYLDVTKYEWAHKLYAFVRETFEQQKETPKTAN